ncbi:MAG: AsmA family protein [Steroidobacteraceae bacterium]
MRILRLIAIGVGGVVAVLFLGIVAVWLLVNPNDYKDKIVGAVRTATGRELALPGAIKLSVFPWIALELGPASLGNPAGFPSGEFLSVQHVALRVKLLPLLRRNLEIGRIEIDQPDLRLQENAQGQGNWQDFGQHNVASEPGSTSHSGGSSIFQSLAGIVVTHAHVSFDTVSINDLNLDVGALAQESSPVGSASRYALAHLRVAGQLQASPGAAALPFQFSVAALDLDLGAQTLHAPDMAAQLATAKLSMTVNGEQILGKPAFTGTVALEPVNLRELLPQLGVTLSATRDAQAYSRLRFSSDFQYVDNSVRLQNLVAQLDDSQLRGSVVIKDIATKATDFNLNLDHIDLDRYRSPPAAAPAAAAPGKPAQLPASPLKTLDVHGTFMIGEAKFSGLTLSDVALNLQAQGGLIQLPALKARLYGGLYSGAISYDVRGPAPQLQLNQQLTGVAMAPLLQDAAKSQRLSGHGNATMTLAGHGPDSEALLNSLTGRFELNLADGAVEGVDLGYEIGAAQALLKQQPLPAGGNTRRTKFDAFRMSATVTDGVARTDDMLVGTPYLRISGQGTTNLVSKALDLQLKATILKAPPASPGADLSQLTLAEIPVSVTGTADSPKVRPDLQGLIKSQLKQKAQDLVKGKLNDKLKGLFGTH